jgi:Zn-dependent protease/CBS domain-containing protein
MPGSLRLGKIAGIDVYAHPSWLIVLVLLTWSLASSWFAQSFPGWLTSVYWIAAFISALLLFACVLVHELAHALVARAHGLTVKRITLFLFGGVATIEEEMKRPGSEFQLAIVGPVTSLILAAVAFLLAGFLRGTGSPGEAVLDYLAVSNLLLGIFNLIPGFPLDGGRVLRSIIWKATGNAQQSIHVASYVGQGIAYLFILLGIAGFFTGNIFNGLWIIFIGWFLLSAAQSARMQSMIQDTLQDVMVDKVMNPGPVAVPANISLQKLVNEYFLPHGLQAAPVVQGEYLAGLIALADIARVERERWAYTPVGHVMRLLEQVYVTAPEQPLYEVLDAMVTRGINQVPVVQDGRLVGLLSRESIIRYLQVRQRLQVDKREYAA